MYTHKFLPLLSLSLGLSALRAQDNSLLDKLNDSLIAHQKISHVTGTFKGLYIVNTQTVESPAAGVLNFEIQHRFGQLNSGSYNFFGLDNATLRLGFDYGISDRLTIGIGRSSYLKTFDGYLKYKLLIQTDGSNRAPVSISLLGIASNYTQHIPEDSFLNSTYRTSYSAQLLIARKFNTNFSLQLSPTYLHYNLVSTKLDKSAVFALGLGGRLKITKRMSIDAEYNYLPPNQIVSAKTYNSFSIGWDIETGGHVFQLVFSNSQSMAETQFIAQSINAVPQATGNWANGDIYFGFNLSRGFNLKKKSVKFAPVN
jgi:opacity protein-like surface antigen